MNRCVASSPSASVSARTARQRLPRPRVVDAHLVVVSRRRPSSRDASLAARVAGAVARVAARRVPRARQRISNGARRARARRDRSSAIERRSSIDDASIDAVAIDRSNAVAREISPIGGDARAVARRVARARRLSSTRRTVAATMVRARAIDDARGDAFDASGSRRRGRATRAGARARARREERDARRVGFRRGDAGRRWRRRRAMRARGAGERGEMIRGIDRATRGDAGGGGVTGGARDGRSSDRRD